MELIIIITKDRPMTLKKSIASIDRIQHNIVVIDNSISQKCQKEVYKICSGASSCTYFGKDQYNRFLSKYEIDPLKFNFLLKEIGGNTWNLGYTRNLALLYSRSQKIKKVLCMDDDIVVPDMSLISYLFNEVENYQFVGANITGLVDDSILGHIATDVEIYNERMLSGGFMIFEPNKIDHYFLNVYNEDWIWLFLQLQGKKYLQTGEVFQELSNPLKNYKDRLLFQEFGEIILDGVLKLYPTNSYEDLRSENFWINILYERLEYINTLKETVHSKDKFQYNEVLEYIKVNFNKFEMISFKKLFDEYFDNRNLFQKLYKSIS